MGNRKRLIRVILVPCLLLVACPMSMAQGLSSNSVVFGGSTKGLKFADLAKDYTTISVSPLLTKTPVGFKQPPIMLPPATAASLLAATNAGVWDLGPTKVPSFYLLPFEVHAQRQARDWSRVSGTFRPAGTKTLVILADPTAPNITKNLSIAEMRERWNELFKKYSTVRALGLSDVVYVEPIANDAVKQRADVLQRHANAIRALKEDPQTNRSPEVIDSILREIAAANANSDEIAALAVVWETDVRKLLEGDSLDTIDAGRITRFAEDLEMLLASEAKAYQCVVTISTSNGPGAEIRYYRSLIGEDAAESFGVSKETRVIERARWTFVSYRKTSGTRIETGREEDVTFHGQSPVNLVIDEK